MISQRKIRSIDLWWTCGALLFIVACGPTDAEKQSAEELNSVTRELDAAYEAWRVEEMGTVNQINKNRFFSQHLTRFDNLRSKLAAIKVAEKHQAARNHLDSLITTSVDLINNRSDLFENISETEDYEPMTSNAASKREVMFGYLIYFSRHHDSLRTAARRQVSQYHQIVGRTILEDSIGQLSRLFKLNSELESAVENAENADL